MNQTAKSDASAVVLTTAGNKEEAVRITEALVSAKLAACVQFVTIDSYYFWEGEVQNDPEILLLIKSLKGDYSMIEETIKASHSYDVPEIIQLDIVDGSADYLSWIGDVTRRARN